MTKTIGLKDLQQNTKQVRQQVSKGTTFIVFYRSKPIFRISPISGNFDFADAFEESGLYKKPFVKKLKEAEQDLNTGRTKEYSTEDFLKSIA